MQSSPWNWNRPAAVMVVDSSCSRTHTREHTLNTEVCKSLNQQPIIAHQEIAPGCSLNVSGLNSFFSGFHGLFMVLWQIDGLVTGSLLLWCSALKSRLKNLFHLRSPSRRSRELFYWRSNTLKALFDCRVFRSSVETTAFSCGTL